jgi:5-formaminoimidazole-4-carboxamide-1-beta-D-ribofuranosyl 5'-monophosphate synthetase
MSSNARPASSSSRTARVYEELQENLESIQKEIANTKTQVQYIRTREFILGAKIYLYIFSLK